MTPGHLDRPALFEEASHLFTALHLLLPRNDPYPADVLLIPDRGWAVDVDVLASRPNLIALISQHGWKVVFPPARVEGQWVPLAAALRGKWTYRDPLRAAEWAAGSMAPPPESSSWAWLDPSAHGMQFLLAAKDEARAQRILDVLSLHLAQGIRAVPILLKPGAAVPPRFRYYWNVFVERPNPFLFEPADGVWWGPVGHGPVDIFLNTLVSCGSPGSAGSFFLDAEHRHRVAVERGSACNGAQPGAGRKHLHRLPRYRGRGDRRRSGLVTRRVDAASA